jgi:rhodanese-related sulfurtransferase
MTRADEIAVEDLAAWRREGRTHTVLDVREPAEIAVARLDGSLDIPMRSVPDRLQEIPRDRPVVVICHHGARSRRVTDWLRRQGWGNVSNLAGGIDAWAVSIDPEMERYR